MSGRIKIALIVFLGMIVGLLSLYLILPQIIASKEKGAISKLKKKGIDLKYASFESSLDTLTFKGINLEFRKPPFLVNCDFEEVTMNVGVFASLQSSPVLDSLQVRNGECEIKKISKKKKDKIKKDKTPSKVSIPKDFPIPDLDIENTILRYKNHSLRIVKWRGGQNKDIEGELRLRALGEKYEILTTGSISENNIKMVLAPKNNSEFDANILGHHFSLKTIDLLIAPKELKGSVAINNFNTKLKGITLNMKSFRVEKSRNKTQFIADGTHLLIPPSLFRRASKTIKADTSLDNATPLFSPLSLLDRLDLQLLDTSVAIQSTQKDAKDIIITEHAKGFFKKGALKLEGKLAEGEIEINALFNMKRKVVHRFDLTFSNIELGRVPGMPSGRSLLPNRGTSGRLGGLLSGAFRLRSPWTFTLDAPLQFVSYLQWRDGFVDFEGVSKAPLENLQLSQKSVGSINLVTLELEDQGRLRSGPISFNYQLGVKGWSEDLTLEFDLQGPKADCAEYFNALPQSFWGPLKNAELEEQAEIKFHLFYPYSRPKDTDFSIEGYKKCKVNKLNSTQKPHVKFKGKKTDLSDVLWLDKAFIMRIKEVEKDAKIFVGPGTRSYVSLNKMGKHVGASAYLSEQVNFYTGRAVNFSLIRRALRRNLDEGRFVYGGSTVTQQLVKNLFLSRDKTISRKLQEMLIAWRVENAISKDRILELYLNCIEFGPNLYGIGPASRHYFQKSATKLTPKESVFLAMLKPAPWRGRWYVNRGATPTNPYFLDRTNVLLDRLLEEEIISEEENKLEKRVGLTWDNEKYTRVLSEEIPEEELEKETLEDQESPPPKSNPTP